MKNLGIVYALLAYFIWGIVPIFWRYLDHIPSTEIVAHRMLWSALLVLLLILAMRQWRDFIELAKNRKIVARLFFASILISLNWGIYIWAVNNGQIVEASMGYFINPLLNVFLGVVLFREQLRLNQWIAIGIAAAGVAYLIIGFGEVPYIALSLAISFGFYGALKKSLEVPATHGMAIETGLLTLPALGFLFFLSYQGELNFGQDMSSDVLLILGGVVTLAPLILFAAAANKISLTALGLTQYLGPSLQLIIGVWMFNEPFGSERQVAFGLIWLALILFTLDQLNARRRRRAVEGAAGVVIKND